MAFWHFSDQFGLRRDMAICGAVAYPSIPAEEEKVSLNRKIQTRLKFNIVSVALHNLRMAFFSFLIDESTEPAYIQTPLGIDENKSFL